MKIKKKKTHVLLEENKILSKSLIWKQMKNLYVEKGPLAWTEVGVPFYLTSHPTFASFYARTVYNYFQEKILTQSLGKGPHVILDLGAGNGRFAYLFLKELCFQRESISKINYDVQSY